MWWGAQTYPPPPPPPTIQMSVNFRTLRCYIFALAEHVSLSNLAIFPNLSCQKLKKKKTVRSVVKNILFSAEHQVRPQSSIYVPKEVPKRDDGDPRPFIWVSPPRGGEGCFLRDERERTPCTPVDKTRRGGWNERNKFAFAREVKCAPKLVLYESIQ